MTSWVAVVAAVVAAVITGLVALLAADVLTGTGRLRRRAERHAALLENRLSAQRHRMDASRGVGERAETSKLVAAQYFSPLLDIILSAGSR